MTHYDLISLQNPRIKQVVKLREDKRERLREKLILVEGWYELNMAVSAGLIPRSVFTAPDLIAGMPVGFDYLTETYTVTREVFEKISYRENPDGWLAIFPMPERKLIDFKPRQVSLVLVAEAVEKPGNLGAILRTADAAGVDALIVTDPRVEIWNPNVIRASRGAVFTVPVMETENAAALDWLRSRQLNITAASPQSEKNYTDLDYRPPTAFVVGTEDRGLSGFWMENADSNVVIRMAGKVNSLNVSVVSALLVYEAIRQRNTTVP